MSELKEVHDRMNDKLREMFEVLDTFLGDTDPQIDEDWTDDDIRDEYPVFWVARELSGLMPKEATDDRK